MGYKPLKSLTRSFRKDHAHIIAMQTAEHEQKIDFFATVKAYFPVLQILAAIFTIGITWYIATSVNASAQVQTTIEHGKRLDEHEKALKELERKLDGTMTKEIFNVYQKTDAERADRLERKVDQLLAERRK